MSLKPIKTWGAGGPNPPKVIMVLEELGLPHEIVPIAFPDLKKPDFLAINPNGRMPAIQDPNSDLTLWESGAIVEYLVEKYDTERKISFEPGSNDAFLAKQWLFFQVSGQGPYYGQAVWFQKFHAEKLPSAIERYLNEAKRVTGVLETHLKRQKEKNGTNEPWLVGNKFSYADLSFVMWQHIIEIASQPGALDLSEFVEVKAWMERMKARPAIKKVMSNLDH